MENLYLPISVEKFQRFLNYSTSKKVIKTNHRGQKARWNDRKATKAGTKCAKRLKGKPLPVLNMSTIDLEDFSYFPTFNSKSDNSFSFIFLCKGMNVLIEKDGSTGAISFNPQYKGIRISRSMN